MSWQRFAPKQYTKAHMKLCFGKGGLAEHNIPFITETVVAKFHVDILVSPNLVVEVDGQSHRRDRRSAKDVWKDRVLSGHGFRVLRLTDRRIERELGEVVAEIKGFLETQK